MKHEVAITEARAVGGQESTTSGHRIDVCICTYKRPELLNRALSKLKEQKTEDLFEYSIIIVDNDRSESARHVAESHAQDERISVSYHVEPEQNIALARNRAIANATGDFIAFIDDDEFPEQDWLLRLYQIRRQYDVDGVLGPVVPYFDERPPAWTLQGQFFDRQRHATGTILQWKSTRTGNVLLNAYILRADKEAFRPELGSGGEDRDFFRRMIERGHKFVWCDEAIVHEIVPAQRWSKTFMLRRAMLRGQQSLVNPSYSKLTIVTSIIAIAVYGLALPFLLLVGRHLFMKYLIKGCDHLGKCLAFAGISVIREKYIVE